MSDTMITIAPDDLDPRDLYQLTISIVIPRPIGWISSLSADGIPNLAPYSFFNAVSGIPPVVLFAPINRRSGEQKDTLLNVQQTGEFVVNVVTEPLAAQMVMTSGEWEESVNEFEIAHLATAPSVDVRPPRVAEAAIAMEAKVQQIIPVEGSRSTLVLGRVVRFHIREGLLKPDGRVDAALLHPVARLGGSEYTTMGSIFTLERPRS